MLKLIRDTDYGQYTFHVNRYKKTVTAILRPMQTDEVIATFAKTMNKASSGALVPCELSFNPKYLIAEKYVGVAKCAPEDDFDLTVGMDIARMRAYQKYAKERNKKLTMIVETLSDTANKLVDFIERTDATVERMNNTIAEFCE